MEKIYILEGKINYCWQWDIVEVTESEKEILENWGIYEDGKVKKIEKEISITEKEFFIKQRFQSEIYWKYSQTDQLNMNARVTEINTLCMIEKRVPTSAELSDIQKATDMVAWIRQKRIDCATEIQLLNQA